MLPAPKNPTLNTIYRRRLLEAAAGNVELQRDIWARASRDYVWFVDTFGWTYSPKDYPDCPNRPFILWDYQEEAAMSLNASMGKTDRLIEKSRDMGATWVCLSVFLWRWMFRKGQAFLIGSRKEDLVDASGDPTCLFWKMDYLIEKLPGWLQPNILRTSMHLENLDSKSCIDGESTNQDFARGGRYAAILLDEFPAVDNGHDILAATRDATKTRIFNGTPQGASGAYYDTRVKMEQNDAGQIIRMHWSKHPEKSVGLYSTHGNLDGGRLEILDKKHSFPIDYKFVQDGKLRSPWYDDQCARAASPQEIAQELDIDYASSGWQFFEAKLLKTLAEKYSRRPLHEGELTFNPDSTHPEWMSQSGARMQLWINPDENGKIPKGREYVVGCDVATGKGGEKSSNSVASVVDRMTGEKVAQFHTNQLSPPDFTAYSLAICRWFNDAFLIWEENGPGGEFTKQVRDLKYRNIFYRDADEMGFQRKKTSKPGWYSGRETKRVLLSDYAKALISGAFINRCEAAIKECGEYVHQPNGTIEHSRSKNTIDPTASGENHGDMVIADALANRGRTELPVLLKEDPKAPPPGSFLARQQLAAKKRNRKDLY